MNWVIFKANAVANFPYDTDLSDHLKLIAGDKLEIMERCGLWIRARCTTTSCQGICPIDRVTIIDNRRMVNTFDLLVHEARCLFTYIFTKVINRNHYMPRPNECEIMDYVRKIQIMIPPSTPESRINISKSLDQLRSKLDLPLLARSKSGSIMNSHDITPQMFSIKSDIQRSDTLTGGNTSVYPPTLAIHLSLSFLYSKEVRICPRLYVVKSDNQSNLSFNYISAPADYILPANDSHEKLIKFHNITSSYFRELALVIRIFSSERYLEKVDKETNLTTSVWGSEYLGVAAVRFNQDKPLSYGNSLTFLLPFYECVDSSFIDVPYILLENKFPDRIQKVDELPQLSVKITPVETFGKAASGIGPDSILTMSLPVNLSPNFESNNLFIKICSLHQKTKFKRTRVILRVINTRSKRYINCFERTRLSSEFATVIQKGPSDLLIDECAQINMSLDEFDPLSCILVFEVAHMSRSRRTSHVVSYAIFKFVDAEGIMKESKLNQEYFNVSLIKSPQEEMNLEDYVNLPETPYDPHNSSRIQITLSFVSTRYTSDPIIHKVLHWDHYREILSSKDNNPLSLLTTVDIKTVMFFLSKLYLCLSRMMSSDQMLAGPALEAFISIIMMIDMYRIELFKHFFNHFVDTMFTRSAPQLASLYWSMLSYLVDSLIQEPQSKHSEISVKKSNDACRCMPYILSIISASLKLNKELKMSVNEEKFKSSIRTIFSRLGALMETDNTAFIISKSFAMRSFPDFCDIIATVFSSNESAQLILNFLNSMKKDPGIASAQSSKSTRQNRIRLYRGLVDTQYFMCEDNRRLVLPFFLNDIKELMRDNRDMADLIQIIVNIFFVMMSSSSSFSHALIVFKDFLIPLLNFSKAKEMLPTRWANQPFPTTQFIILILYFTDIQIVKQFIQSSRDPIDMFKTLLNTIHRVVELNPPPYIFFICASTFISIVQMATNFEKDFLNKEKKSSLNLQGLISIISSFYNDFYRILKNNLNETDRIYFQRTYFINLEPIAALLPRLLTFSPNDVSFNTSVLSPLFHLYMNQKDAASRNTILDAFFMITENDYKQNGNFNRSENAILAMDNFMQADTAADLDDMLSIVDIFDKTIPKFGVKSQDPVVSGFFKRMKDLARFMFTISSLTMEDELTTACINSLNSLTVTDLALYSHFTSQLFNINMNPEHNNICEAAETLVLCAKIFKWDDDNDITAGFNFPPQKRRVRKIEMMNKAIELFMKDDFYERALDILSELRDYYTDIEGDYEKLEEVAAKEAQCYDMICTKERTVLNRFYGIRFYGNRFNQYFRNKLYIYRRDGFYMATQIMQEMKDHFPQARVEPKAPTDEDKRDPNLFYIHVFNIKPRDVEGFDPFEDLSAIMTNSCLTVDTFYSETPVRIKRTDAKYNEMAEWYRHITMYKTERPLQGIARRSLVVEESKVIVMTPIECAIYDTNAKTMELMHSASSVWRAKRFNLPIPISASSSLNLLIQGIVNAAVNGGTKVFQDLFLEGPLKDEPGNQKFAGKLIRAFDDQLKAINFALKIHESIMTSTDQALHEVWVENFNSALKTMSRVIGEINLNEQPSFGKIPPVDFLEEEINEKKKKK
ncbi:hypothetical protein M9Y10_001194 [Tritrichomonas musculus]|uniref:SH3 domain-containing protein n=1 Tax=Tritrichomonas musculus TaxID=1915356 RepID=A0ABR2L6P2_9EUKA